MNTAAGRHVEGRSTFRAWLYRIATNACLDLLAQRPQRVPTELSEVLWLQPCPDHLLEKVAPAGDDPEAAVIAKETIELAFVAALQHLPPRQRAILILRDVLGRPTSQVAALLETTATAAHSGLQRARGHLKQHLPSHRSEWKASTGLSADDQELLRRYVDANDQGDAQAIIDLMHEDARFSLPPQPGVWIGRELIANAWMEGGFGSAEFGELRSTLTGANLQPVVTAYVRGPGDSRFRPLGMDVLRIEHGLIAEIVSFEDKVFSVFGLRPAP